MDEPTVAAASAAAATMPGELRHVVVLGVPPNNSAADAVKAAVVAKSREGQR